MKTSALPQSGLIALTMVLAACGGSSDSPAERELAMEDAAAKHGIDVDVTLNDGGEPDKVVIETIGGQAGSGLALPPGFPDDVFVATDWNIMASSAPMSGMYNVQALAEQSSADIVSALRDTMTSRDWSESDFAQMTPQMVRLSFEKGTQMTTYTITENGETHLIQVVSMPKP